MTGLYSQVLKMISEPGARPLSFFIICKGNYRHLDQFDHQQISNYFLKAQMMETKDMVQRLAEEEHTFVDGGIRLTVKDLGCVDWWKRLVPRIPELDTSRGGYVFSPNGHTPFAYLRTSCRMIPACSGTPAIGFVEALKAVNPGVFPELAPVVAWNVGEGSYRGMPHVVMLVKLPHVLAEEILSRGQPLRLGLNRLRFFPAAPGEDSLPEELKKLFKTSDEPQESTDQDMGQEIPEVQVEPTPPPLEKSFDRHITELEVAMNDLDERLPEPRQVTNPLTNDSETTAMDNSNDEID